MTTTDVSPELTIRRAREAEYREVGELTAQAYLADGFIPEGSDYGDRLRDAGTRASEAELLVAVDGAGRVLGTVTICPPGSVYVEVAEPDELEFRMLAVDPSARGRGVARALVEEVLAAARERGFARVVLSSADIMEAAHRLYARLGFTRMPERDWKPLPGVNLLALALRLDIA